MVQTLFFESRDPADVTAFSFDWSGWVATSDNIESATITVTPTDLNSSAVLVHGRVVSVFLTGGTVGQTYNVACLVTTTNGLTARRSATVFTTLR